MGHKPKTEKARHYINQEQKRDSKGLFLRKKRGKILSEKGLVTISDSDTEMVIKIEKNDTTDK